MKMSLFFERIYRGAIKLLLLTGVSFTVTACYGAPYREYQDDADTTAVEEAQHVVEAQLADSQYVE
jgi:hypothetical protein